MISLNQKTRGILNKYYGNLEKISDTQIFVARLLRLTFVVIYLRMYCCLQGSKFHFYGRLSIKTSGL